MTRKEYRKAHYWANRQAYIDRASAWNAAHPEKREQICGASYRKHVVRIKAHHQEHAQKPEVRARRKVVRALNAQSVFADKFRTLVRVSLKYRGASKSCKTVELVGCPMPSLVEHLERQFKPGMTWDNHGEWHVDHVKPCASFDLTDPAQQKVCFHFSNLQPLWAAENITKGARVN